MAVAQDSNVAWEHHECRMLAVAVHPPWVSRSCCLALNPTCHHDVLLCLVRAHAGSVHLHGHLLRLSCILWPVIAMTREFQLLACQWWWKVWGYQGVDFNKYTLNTLYRVSRRVCCQCCHHTSWAWHSGKFTGFGTGQTWVQIPTPEFYKNSTPLLKTYYIPAIKLSTLHI